MSENRVKVSRAVACTLASGCVCPTPVYHNQTHGNPLSVGAGGECGSGRCCGMASEAAVLVVGSPCPGFPVLFLGHWSSIGGEKKPPEDRVLWLSCLPAMLMDRSEVCIVYHVVTCT